MKGSDSTNGGDDDENNDLETEENLMDLGTKLVSFLLH